MTAFSGLGVVSGEGAHKGGALCLACGAHIAPSLKEHEVVLGAESRREKHQNSLAEPGQLVAATMKFDLGTSEVINGLWCATTTLAIRRSQDRGEGVDPEPDIAKHSS